MRLDRSFDLPAEPNHSYLFGGIMAAEQNTGATGADNNDMRVDIATLLFELRIALEATAVGLKLMINRPIATSIQRELAILFRLVEQAAEALNALDGVMEPFLARRAGVSEG
jgi:hypothetical protein